jgi:micrococcal nuclease
MMTPRRQGGRRWGMIIFALFLLAAPGQTLADAAEVHGRVQWIYDGDTIRVSGIGTVRLIGIDTPERKPSERDRYFIRMGVDPGRLRTIAEDSLRYNIRTAKGRNVRLAFDADRKDRHGRTLAYVYLPDGRMLNRLLIEEGYAVVYRRFDFMYKNDFITAEEEARQRGVGLWQGDRGMRTPGQN